MGKLLIETAKYRPRCVMFTPKSFSLTCSPMNLSHGPQLLTNRSSMWITCVCMFAPRRSSLVGALAVNQSSKGASQRFGHVFGLHMRLWQLLEGLYGIQWRTPMACSIHILNHMDLRPSCHNLHKFPCHAVILESSWLEILKSFWKKCAKHKPGKHAFDSWRSEFVPR